MEQTPPACREIERVTFSEMTTVPRKRRRKPMPSAAMSHITAAGILRS